MAYLLEQDTLNGKEGRGFWTDQDGNVHEIVNAKNIKTDAALEESDMKVVGTRIVQKKTTGIQYSGTMNIYYGSPEFKQMIAHYAKTGIMPYFTLQVTNDDPATTVGRQVIVYYNCKIQSSTLSMLDVDADMLTEDVPFTFTSFEIIEGFKAPARLG